MTTITINRATVEQALEALEQSETTVPYEGFGMARRVADRKHQAAIDALRAALAQQAEPVSADAAYQRWLADTHAPALRRMDSQGAFAAGWQAALAQQAEPVEPVACGDLKERKALSSVKLPCDVRIGHGTHRKGSSLLALVVRSRSLYQMAKSGDYYGYAVRLAVAIWEKHYKDSAPHWKPLDDLMGVLTQIDNMTSGLTRLAQQAEPVEPPKPAPLKRGTTGRCTRKVCECEKEGLGPECIHLEPVIDGYPLWSGIPKAEPVEPVAWVNVNHLQGLTLGLYGYVEIYTDESHGRIPLYTAPPQRKPLTEEEIAAEWQKASECASKSEAAVTTSQFVQMFARAVERAHGIGEEK